MLLQLLRVVKILGASEVDIVGELLADDIQVYIVELPVDVGLQVLRRLANGIRELECHVVRQGQRRFRMERRSIVLLNLLRLAIMFVQVLDANVIPFLGKLVRRVMGPRAGTFDLLEQFIDLSISDDVFLSDSDLRKAGLR